MRTRYRVMAVMALVGQIACDDRSVAPRARPDASLQQPAPNNRPAVSGAKWERDHLAREERIPGFGGFFYDSVGNMRVMLTDTSRIALARAELTPTLRARPRGAGIRPGGPAPSGSPQIIAVKARYSFSQLLAWKNLASRRFLGKGVTQVGIRMSANRVTIGLGDPAIADQVHAALIAAGIPADALLVEASSGGRPGATLESNVSPIVGGLRIRGYYTEANSVCGLGFNVLYTTTAGGVARGFITNSHCTAVRGGTNRTTFYQPALTGGRVIGNEIADREWTADGDQCPTLAMVDGVNWFYPENGQEFECRYSDAALIALTATTDWNHGRIARTLFSGTGPDTGSRTISTTYPSWKIVATYDPQQGDVVHMVGPTSGWTWGVVDQPCSAVQYEKPDGFSFTHYVGLCQATSEFHRFRDGDSGSPVFIINDHEAGLATLVGLATATVSQGRHLSFSMWGEMAWEVDGNIDPIARD